MFYFSYFFLHFSGQQLSTVPRYEDRSEENEKKKNQGRGQRVRATGWVEHALLPPSLMYLFSTPVDIISSLLRCVDDHTAAVHETHKIYLGVYR